MDEERITIWRVESDERLMWVCDKRQLWKIRATSPQPLKIKQYQTTREVWEAFCERSSSRLHS